MTKTSKDASVRDGEPKQVGALALAIGLAGLAGWVDGTGFVTFHGLFTSFMSGNTTKVASNAGFDEHVAIEAGRSIVLFVIGVTLGELAGAVSDKWGRPIVLALATVLLAGAALTDHLQQPEYIVGSLLALAMGTQNASVHKAAGLSMALTYVTGTLVHVGRGIAEALRGAAAWSAILPFLGLWMGFLCGGIGGSLTARHSALVAMIAAAAIAAIFTLYTLIHRLAWSAEATAEMGK